MTAQDLFLNALRQLGAGPDPAAPALAAAQLLENALEKLNGAGESLCGNCAASSALEPRRPLNIAALLRQRMPDSVEP